MIQKGKLLLLTIALFLIFAPTLPFENNVIDLNQLPNYANQFIPEYIKKDNTPIDNEITDEGATLGRVLFYDKQLSLNNQIACASCHQQENAFSDLNDLSEGVAGLTNRHSMRLINARFSEEHHFFWDERAPNLEALVTMPIKDHIEMGFSGINGNPTIDSLISKLTKLPNYPILFEAAFGNTLITEEKIQKAVAQFIRSIQSFDSPYDAGLTIVGDNLKDFPNFSTSENNGKLIFMTDPIFDDNGIRIAGGAGCANCHRPPEFDIDPASGNNGIIANLGDTQTTSINITRSPSLRDVCNEKGQPYGGFMHNSSMGIGRVIYDVTKHYGEEILFVNENLDHRLAPNGVPQKLRLSVPERKDLGLFIRTLKGNNVYTDKKWSDPFDANGQLNIRQLSTTVGADVKYENAIKIYPNPFSSFISIEIDYPIQDFSIQLFDQQGRLILKEQQPTSTVINIIDVPAGLYFLKLIHQQEKFVITKKVVKGFGNR